MSAANGQGQERVLTEREGTVVMVRHVIAAANEIAGMDVRQRCNRAAVAKVRFAAYAVARGMGKTLPEIGRLFKRDHSTVSHGVRKSLPEMEEVIRIAAYRQCAAYSGRLAAGEAS